MSRSFGVTVRGHRTRIVDAGRGEPVVLVHGTPLDLTSWDGVVAAVPGRRTVRYDVRGHGAAAGTPVPGPQELAADLVAVLDEVNVEAAHLVGHSWGGEIVLQTALDHPQRVSRLSVVCSRAAPFPAFLDVAAGLAAGFDVMAALPAIGVPVDVGAAEFDGVAVPGHMAAIAAALPRSRYLMVTGAHHLLPMQEPGLVGGVLTAGD